MSSPSSSSPPSPSSAQSAAAFAMSTRVLAATLMGALVLIGVALVFVLPAPHGTGALVVLGVQVLAGLVVHTLLDAVGYRTPSLEPSLTDEDAATRARTAWQTAMVLRFAIAELIAIVSIATAFVLPEGDIATYAGGAVVSLLLMAVHVWPWARPVGRTADALEAGGKRSGLREAFGLGDPGAIQRL